MFIKKARSGDICIYEETLKTEIMSLLRLCQLNRKKKKYDQAVHAYIGVLQSWLVFILGKVWMVIFYYSQLPISAED